MTDHAELSETLATAINGLVGDDKVVTGFTMIIEYLDEEGEPSWTWASQPGQRMITTMGQAQWLHGIVKYEQRRYLAEPD